MTFVFDFERLFVKTFSFADFAGNVNIRQKMHFNRFHTVASQASQRPPFTLKLKRPGR